MSISIVVNNLSTALSTNTNTSHNLLKFLLIEKLQIKIKFPYLRIHIFRSDSKGLKESILIYSLIAILLFLYLVQCKLDLTLNFPFFIYQYIQNIVYIYTN